jgi:predicted nucleic acid-binding protein
MFLLDTMTVSEMSKTIPDAGLTDWLSSVEWNDLYLSVISIAEIWQGIAALPNGQRRRALEAWFEFLPESFSGRILPVDFAVSIRYGELQARHDPLPVLDTLIAATALVHRMTVITRNTKDLGRTGASVLDPWG